MVALYDNIVGYYVQDIIGISGKVSQLSDRDEQVWTMHCSHLLRPVITNEIFHLSQLAVLTRFRLSKQYHLQFTTPDL